MKISKRIASLFLAGALSASLAAPAFASSGKVDVAGAINLPTINVVLPTAASLTLNPYGLNVKLSKTDTEGVTDKVISPTMYVKNLSNIGVQVKATVAGTVGKGSTAQFLTAAPTSSTEDKGAYVYVLFNIQDDATTELEAPSTAPTPGTTYGTALVNVVATGDDPAEVKGFELDATASTAAGTANQLAPTATKDPAEGGVLAFRFFGDAVASPKDDDGNLVAWTDKDTLSASIAFTFDVVPGAIVTD